MLEITLTELLLTLWAGIATALYFHEKHQAHMARVVFMHFVENPDAREQMLKQWEKAQGEA